ncbi:MAG: competence/damage-inducible protein A [Flavobacteriales bacterium]|nr:competence/damage-inducible protein A [Flavobacteriales bacterium]
MQAEIITIGDELLIGQTVDTNSAWIGAELAKLGIEVFQITSITDKKEHILSSLKNAEERSDLILITGGLGPTKDDITKETLCEYFNTSLEMNQEVLDEIEGYFQGRGMEVLQVNKDQALLPKDAKVIRNWQGTASGMWFEKGDRVFVSMPGVPYEMQGMMEESVLPMVNHYFKVRPRVHKTVMTQGIGESSLAELIKDWESDLRENGYGLAYLPSPGIVKLRITAYADSQNDASELVYQKIQTLKPLIEKYIYGYDGVTLSEVVGKLLIKRNATVSTAESCTSGYLASQITTVPGSSSYFVGSVIAYSYDSKTSELGVEPDDLIKYGAVSQQVIEQMATGIREKLKTDYAIATSGIAGPGGGTPDKPVGTVWIAIASNAGVISKRFQFGNHRERNVQKTTVCALSMLRKVLVGK